MPKYMQISSHKNTGDKQLLSGPHFGFRSSDHYEYDQTGPVATLFQAAASTIMQ